MGAGRKDYLGTDQRKTKDVAKEEKEIKVDVFIENFCFMF